MKKMIVQSIPYFIILCSFTLPRLGHLGQYVTADEPMYLRESASFYYALSHGDFSSTFRVIQPGIPTLWTGAAGFLLRFPAYRHVGNTEIADLHFKELLQEYQHSPLEMLAFSRSLVVLITAVLMLACYYYAQRAFGALPSLVGFTIIALDPVLFAHGRLLASDWMLAGFAFLSLLALVDFNRYQRKRELVVSGLASGLACLSKTTGAFLIPMAGIMIMWCAWHTSGNRTAWIKRATTSLGIWFLSTAAVYVLFFPAMWVIPLKVLTRMLSFSLESASGEHNTNSFFNGRLFPGGDIGWSYFYYYPLTFLWRTTPVVMIGIISALVFWKTYRDPAKRIAILWLLFYCTLYTAVMTLSSKKMDRYLTPVYPPLDLLTGVGLVQFTHWVKERKTKTYAQAAAYLVIAATLVWQGVLLFRAYPYPLSYYNPVMGGPKRAPAVMMIGWGEGLDQAARFLNQQPGIEHKQVVAWYAAAFNFHFDKWAGSIPIRSEIDNLTLSELINSDYAVIYVHQWQRRSSAPLLDYLAQYPPIYSFSQNGIEYVRVYDLGDIRSESGSTP